MAEIVPFPDAGGREPALGEVGGKGMSLWRMSSVQGVQVPSGFVLTLPFFEKWFEGLKKTPSWEKMLSACKSYDADNQASIKALHSACEAAKKACEDAAFDEAQLQSVSSAVEAMSQQGAVDFVAVRSSSPEEDLAGMSFAGGYETVLGVKAQVKAIEAAVKRVFASCLDERVFVYKISHGIPDLTPRIAVVVQRQVAARVAGVAFSLDPISNCYDWATINTNWGLGETVVSGQCSPDYYMVNKVTQKALKQELGKKERSVWLDKNGGVYEEVGQSSEFTLSDAQVAAVTTQLVTLEKFYGHPIDTEFAFDDGGHLLWLQARPITTHVEIPQQIMTEPGCPEVLWLDLMQIVQGFTQLASTTGLSFLKSVLLGGVMSTVLGLSPDRATIHNRPLTIVPEAGVAYINASFIMRLMGFAKRDSWAEKVELMDFNVAKIIRELDDPSIVKSASPPPVPLLMAWNMPGLFANIRKNMYNLEDAVRRSEDAAAGIWRMASDLYVLRGHGQVCGAKGAFQQQSAPSNTREWMGALHFAPTEEAIATAMKGPPGTVTCCFRRESTAGSPHIVDILEQVVTPILAKTIFHGFVPGVIAAALTMRKAKQPFEKAPAEMQALLDDLTQGTPFVTTVLSDLLEDMAEALAESGKSFTVADLIDGIKKGGAGLPEKAWAIWQTVIDQFGHRGVGELDISQPRYREEPEMLLEQVISIGALQKDMRPRGLAAAALRKREAATEKLGEWLSANGGDVQKFKERVAHYHKLFCYRESGKYYIIKFVDLARREVLTQAEGLVADGRMDSVQDVWFLTLTDLKEIRRDKAVDVRALIKERRAYRDRTAHVKSWPKVVTSRGRQLRAKPRPAKDGEVLGHAVSPGVVRGRIKVLHEPREKPLHTGEVLVAKATDPGWTPLFVPAAAVLLEVGGALQHGALVAREFGKPCVAGIEDVTEKFRDGMLVEVDGTEGIVRVLEPGGADAGAGTS